MASEKDQGWRELKRISQTKCPKLFFNVSSQGTGLQLLFTDLIAIWECNLSKSDILDAAQEQKSSIDPSESNSQLQVLVQKLEQGIRSDVNTLYRDQDEKSQTLYLRTHVELPQPLQPLVWTFKLLPQDAVELGEQLLRPCLFEASVSRQKLSSLQRMIKDKDHVISRLLERLESSNTDLSLIFPGVKSRRGRITVAEAEKHVPGMAAFDPVAWSNHFDDDSPYASYDTKGFDNLVSGCQKCPAHTAREHADWYNHLAQSASEMVEMGTPIEVQTTFSERHSSDEDVDASASEDEFERQKTPPHLQKKSTIHNNDIASVMKGSKSQPGLPSHSTQTRTNPTIANGTTSKLTESRSEAQKLATKVVRSNIQSSSEDDDEEENDDLDRPSQNTLPKRRRSRSTSRETENQSQNHTKNIRSGNLRDSGPNRLSNSSSPEPSEQPKRRLGALKKAKIIERPKVDQSGNTSEQQKSPAPRSHRLGRLGKKNPEASPHDNDAQTETRSTSRVGVKQKHHDHKLTSNAQDSDVTASATPSPDPSPEPDSKRPVGQQSMSSSKTAKTRPANKNDANIKSEDADGIETSISLNQVQKYAEPPIELSTEEKANLRREELKRKVDGGAGTKKKRKF